MMHREPGFQRRAVRGRFGFFHNRSIIGRAGQLETFGRLLISAVMFWGRLGAITILFALLKRGRARAWSNTRRRWSWPGESARSRTAYLLR